METSNKPVISCSSKEPIITTMTNDAFLDGLNSLPRWEEIPDWGLYMDQLITYLNEKLSFLESSNHKKITSSMVNNYVKSSIVKPPIKKLYKRYHIAFLIIVFILKSCFSLSAISQMIEIYSNIEDPGRVARDYNKAIYVLKVLIKNIMERQKEKPVFFQNPTKEQELFVTVLNASAYKLVSDQILDSVSTG